MTAYWKNVFLQDIARHEAGHAVIAGLYPEGGRITEVKVDSTGGYVQTVGEDLETEVGLRANIRVMLSGYISSKYFGKTLEFIDTPFNDFEVAFEYAQKLSHLLCPSQLNNKSLALRILFDELQTTLKLVEQYGPTIAKLSETLVEKGQVNP